MNASDSGAAGRSSDGTPSTRTSNTSGTGVVQMFKQVQNLTISNEKNTDDLLLILNSLTKLIKDHQNREQMTSDNIHELALLLVKNSEVICCRESGREHETSDFALRVCTECIRCMRNACVQCTQNQEAILSSNAISTALHLITFITGCDSRSQDLLVLLRCCIQFLTNLTSGHIQSQTYVWKLVFPTALLVLLKVDDEKTAQYSCVLMQACLSNPECHGSFEVQPAGSDVMDCVLALCAEENEHDFSLQLVQMTLKSPTIVKHVFEKLTDPAKITLLDVANACLTEESDHPNQDGRHHASISEATMLCFAERFRDVAHNILSLAMHSHNYSNLKPRLVMSLLGVLCLASANAHTRNWLQEADFLLQSSLELLNMVDQVGRSSANVFSGSQNLDDSSQDTAGPQSPAHGFKKDLVQLIGNLCFRHRANQDKVRELKGIPIILQQCNIDVQNPFINQWAILAIRNLCEENLENQAFIASLRSEGVADNESLARLGFEAVMRDDGQVYLRNTKKK